MNQDNTEDYIKKHINCVQYWMQYFAEILLRRSKEHDRSKLEEPELSQWKKMDEEPRYSYESKEYLEKKKRYESLFKMHWKHNRHHPEYFDGKIFPDRDLIDLIEMLSDWLGYKDHISYSEASSLVKQQTKRYNFSSEIEDLLLNTLKNWFVTFECVPAKSELIERNKKVGQIIDFYA